MWAICVSKALGTNLDYFLEVGKVYEILSEDSFGYYTREHGWVLRDHLSIQEFRESQLTEILNDTSLEM